MKIVSDYPLGPNAIRADGKIAVVVGSPDSWWFGAGVLDPQTGILRRTPLRYDGDVSSLSWNRNNEIVTAGFLMRASIWRFQPRSQ